MLNHMHQGEQVQPLGQSHLLCNIQFHWDIATPTCHCHFPATRAELGGCDPQSLKYLPSGSLQKKLLTPGINNISKLFRSVLPPNEFPRNLWKIFWFLKLLNFRSTNKGPLVSDRARDSTPDCCGVLARIHSPQTHFLCVEDSSVVCLY